MSFANEIDSLNSSVSDTFGEAMTLREADETEYAAFGIYMAPWTGITVGGVEIQRDRHSAAFVAEDLPVALVHGMQLDVRGKTFSITADPMQDDGGMTVVYLGEF